MPAIYTKINFACFSGTQLLYICIVYTLSKRLDKTAEKSAQEVFYEEDFGCFCNYFFCNFGACHLWVGYKKQKLSIYRCKLMYNYAGKK